MIDDVLFILARHIYSGHTLKRNATVCIYNLFWHEFIEHDCCMTITDIESSYELMVWEDHNEEQSRNIGTI